MNKQSTRELQTDKALTYRDTLRDYYNEMATLIGDELSSPPFLQELEEILVRAQKLKSPEREMTFISELCGKGSKMRLAA